MCSSLLVWKALVNKPHAVCICIKAADPKTSVFYASYKSLKGDGSFSDKQLNGEVKPEAQKVGQEAVDHKVAHQLGKCPGSAFVTNSFFFPINTDLLARRHAPNNFFAEQSQDFAEASNCMMPLTAQIFLP